jgi:hypothetical protein
MSPLQRIAMGLVIVFGKATFPANPHPGWKVYDGLADPIGWILVIAGVTTLVRADQRFAVLRWPAWIAGAVSVPLWVPQISHHLDDANSWAASLPQLAFCILMSKQVAEGAALHDPPDAYVAKRFGLLLWAFVVITVLPPIAIGGDVTALDNVTVALSYLVDIAFVYYLFRVHRREWLGGPGPLLVHPQKHEGRPPSS